jgi:hypothetical protein
MEQLPALKPATNTTNNSTARPTLEEVSRRFETWRRGRKHGSRIPNCLWKAAVEACAAHRVWQVSKVLGLSYNDLKRRVVGTGQIEKMPTPAKADFVEVSMGLRTLPVLCSVEIESAAYGKLKMSFARDFDPVELARVFFGVRR